MKEQPKISAHVLDEPSQITGYSDLVEIKELPTKNNLAPLIHPKTESNICLKI